MQHSIISLSMTQTQWNKTNEVELKRPPDQTNTMKTNTRNGLTCNDTNTVLMWQLLVSSPTLLPELRANRLEIIFKTGDRCWTSQPPKHYFGHWYQQIFLARVCLRDYNVLLSLRWSKGVIVFMNVFDSSIPIFECWYCKKLQSQARQSRINKNQDKRIK